MWISKEKYEKLQRQVADSKVKRYYYKKGVDDCITCSFERGFPETVGAYPCIMCDNLIEYGGDNSEHPWVRCRKRPEGRSVEQAESMKDKFDGITKAILGIKDDGKPKEVLSWEKLYYEGHAKWNAECLNLKNRIKELEAQLAEKIEELSQMKSVSEYWRKNLRSLESKLKEKQAEIARLISEKDPSTIAAKDMNSYLENARSTGSIVDSIFGNTKEREGIVIDLNNVTKHVRKPLNFSDFEKEVEVKPYYFERLPSPREFIVTETCDIMGRDINIGSMSCRQCINCITNNREDFIKCKLKPEGKAKKPEWDTINIGGIKISTLKQEPKKTERFKRDEYGIISETDEFNNTCFICTYANEDIDSEVCKHCKKDLKGNEYYSSK